ncbi:hypothetical protein RBJ15_08685 [Pantoea sp. BS_4]|uniref:hypothetical protein n=1 Tax=Pantoea TaxID=53335 RepID=UPI00128EC54F|nr:hypothetical protein [Pantoea stewartii]
MKCTPPKTFRQGRQKLFVVAPLCPLFVVATLPFVAKGQIEKEKRRVRGRLFRHLQPSGHTAARCTNRISQHEDFMMKKISAPGIPDTQDLPVDAFMDLCDYVWMHGEFLGPSGFSRDDFNGLVVIDEPTEEPDALKVYMRDGWPVAVYEFDIGYTVIRRPSFQPGRHDLMTVWNINSNKK